MTDDTSEILDKAADELLIRGWVRGGEGWVDHNTGPNQPVCVEGALQAAIGLMHTSSEFYTHPAYKRVEDAVVTNESVVSVATGHALNVVSPYLWNDHVAKDAGEVIELLRGLAKQEREKETHENE